MTGAIVELVSIALGPDESVILFTDLVFPTTS